MKLQKTRAMRQWLPCALVITAIFLPNPCWPAQDLFFDSEGVRIHYTVEGHGDPVLLIHGFGANIEMNWSSTGIIKELSSNFHVIAIDNRGHGKSGKPHDPAAYGMEMIKDSIRLLDHLKIQRAHVVGYSMGGRIACALLGFYPERLRTAVLGGAGWFPPGDAWMGGLQRELAESLKQGKGVGPLLMALNPPGNPPPTPEQIAMTNKLVLSAADTQALAAVMSNPFPSPDEAQLRAVKIPVLSLIGELDPMKISMDRLQGVVPDFRMVVIPKATHGTATRSPEFVGSLKNFLLQHSLPAR